jgi:spore coat polysaccharide biosynthesis predicted glycosyltransferase SpsG
MPIGSRADTWVQIGTGYVMRCLMLAYVEDERGAQSLFFCRSQSGHFDQFDCLTGQ